MVNLTGEHLQGIVGFRKWGFGLRAWFMRHSSPFTMSISQSYL